MNNYEHIMQGGIGSLMDWHRKSMETCDTCAGCSGHEAERSMSRHKRDGFMTLLCIKQQKKWLEAEYVEPPSWERLLEDMGKDDDGTLPCGYFGHEPDSCTDDCPAFGSGFSCWYMAMKDIERRIRELRGEEE